MKKLNRKGFTLVELLAVIIILAIVVGISIPAVLTTTKNAKDKAFQTAADTAADWFDRQYQVALTGLNDTGIATLDSNFTSLCGTDNSNCTETKTVDNEVVPVGEDTTSSSVMAAAGLKSSNVETMNVYINASTGRSCVTLTAKSGGDYDGAGTKVTTGSGETATTVYQAYSSNCTQSTGSSGTSDPNSTQMEE